MKRAPIPAVATLGPNSWERVSETYEVPMMLNCFFEGAAGGHHAALLLAIHAHCYGRGPNGEKLPPEKIAWDNLLAEIAAACEAALVGEEVRW